MLLVKIAISKFGTKEKWKTKVYLKLVYSQLFEVKIQWKKHEKGKNV